jgi:hypothetical protein
MGIFHLNIIYTCMILVFFSKYCKRMSVENYVRYCTYWLLERIFTNSTLCL